MSAALLYLVVFVGGVLTILSPCILPVLPFVFARAGRPFYRETVPMLAGLALSFTVVASAATAGAAWVAHAADWSRWAALVVLGVTGAALLSPSIAEAVTRPLVRVGNGLLQRRHANESAGVGDGRRGVRGAIAIGLATGLLWAPCAGPILGLVVAASIAEGAVNAPLLFLTFALGASVSLMVGVLASGRLLAALRRHLAADIWIRRGLGVVSLAAVGLIALGLDAKLLSGAGLARTTAFEEALIKAIAPHAAGAQARTLLREPVAQPARPPVPTPDEGVVPSFDGATAWLNSPALTRQSLRGKVFMVDFWTFECYNCRNALPYVKALYAKYKDQGFVVVGVHTPEFAREKIAGNVLSAMKTLGVEYPVVQDNGFAIWRAFENRYWPAAYIVDKQGHIRYHYFGEGAYAEQERVVQQLLAEPNPAGSR